MIFGQSELRKWDLKKVKINTASYFLFFFQVYTVHLGNYQSFFSPPTDAQLDSLKNNFKLALKLTLKTSHMFRRKTPSSGSTLFESC